MTGSLTGQATFHHAFDLPRAFSKHCADKVEEMILAEGPETIAAFIGEPVLGTGIVPSPAGYWQKNQAVLDRYDILLVADKVVTGFGRLGSMFGSDHYGMKPDLITIAKGRTSLCTARRLHRL